MFKLKACPRCHGDLFVDRDYYGWYEQCIQCGHMAYHKVAATSPGAGQEMATVKVAAAVKTAVKAKPVQVLTV